MIIIIEDDVLIAWDLKLKIRELTSCDVDIYESYVDYISTAISGSQTVFCNLRLCDGWLTENELNTVVSRADRFILFTGLSDSSCHYVSSFNNANTSVLLKPYTSHQLKQVLRA